MVHIRDINEYLDAKTVIIIVLTVIFLTLTVLCIIRWDSLQVTENLLSKEEVSNTQYQTAIADLRKQQQEQSDAEQAVKEALLKKIPSVPDEAGLIEIFDRLGEETASEVSDIAFATRTQKENVLEMPMTVKLVTDYYAFVRFLEGLRESDRFIQPVSIEIATDTELSGVLRVTVDANAYAMIGTRAEE